MRVCFCVWADVFVGARALQVILQPDLHLPQLGAPAHVLHLCYLRGREEEGEARKHAVLMAATGRPRGPPCRLCTFGVRSSEALLLTDSHVCGGAVRTHRCVCTCLDERVAG